MSETALLAAAPPSAAPPPAVRARGLEVVFGGGGQRVVALEGIDLTIEQGAFTALIGPSGCGKTTLLRLIADLERPSAGELRVNGMTPEEARRRRAYGYVFQAPALFPWRTVIDNVALPLEIMGVPAAERRARAERQLTLVGLQAFARKYPWQLSGGMQQRVSIARALALEPRLLLMDEPFGALDEITRDGLNLHLYHLWRQTGMTVVFVTHSIAEAVFLATDIVVMSARPGRIVARLPNTLPARRTLEIRETEAFLAVAQQVREALRAGHSYA
jgi:NitT/TauT family transport system ATP-binding protein